MKFKYLVLASAVALTGCGSDSDDAVALTGCGSDSDDAVALTGCGSDSDDAEKTFLEGSWLEQSCYNANDELTEYIQSTFQYSGNQVIIHNHTYNNSDCSGDPIFEGRFQGDLALGENKIITSGDTVTQYTITVNSAIFTALTQASAASLSSEAYCDMSDWSVDVARSIYDCKFGSQSSSVLQEIAMIDGDTLYRGAYEEKDETGYSTALEISNPYLKQ